MEQSLVYPQVLPKSIESVPYQTDKNITKNKRYFKIFVISNQKTLPTNNDGSELIWSIDHVNTIERDVDTFIDSGITWEKNGDHPRPSREGIHEADYKDPMEFVNVAKKFYNTKSVAKVLDIYHPDSNLLNAAVADNNQTKVLWTAFAEALDPDSVDDPERKQKIIEFHKELDRREKANEPLYVSPGIYALKDIREGNKSIVQKFAATHIAIVDNPAFTKPDAFIRKEICKVDGHTCRFKLLTASEMVKLNNNLAKSLTMADQATATVPKPNEIITEDQKVTTEVFDSKGKKVEETTAEKKETVALKEKDDRKETPASKRQSELQKLENKVEEKTAEIEKTPEGKLVMSIDDLKNIMGDYKKEIIKEVEERTEAKNEKVLKVETLNTYINAENKDLKEEYEFYSKLNVSSQELKHILENSKYAVKDKKGNHMYASASSSVETSKYSSKTESAQREASASEYDVDILYSGQAIPDRYK